MKNKSQPIYSKISEYQLLLLIEKEPQETISI